MDVPPNVLQFIRVGGLIPALVVLAASWFVSQLVARFTDSLGERFTDKRLQLQQVGTVVRFGLFIGAIATAVLLTFRLSDQMLLALSGTIAVTAGFALKDLAASILAGITILIDRPFQVGDRISFAGEYGEVRSIGLRSVRLATLDDNLVTIPNNKFLTDAVSCGNAGALDMLIQMDFFIGADQDVVAARQVVLDAITSTRYAYLEKPWAIAVNQLVHQGYFAIRLRAKVYVLDVRYETALATDVNLRVIEGFRVAHVAPPAVLHRSLGGAPIEPLAAVAASALEAE